MRGRILTEKQIGAFAVYLKGEEKSENTIEKYKEDARNILAWAQRLYAQADEEQQLILKLIILDFQRVMDSNILSAINQKKQKVLPQLLKLEMMINRDYFGDDDVISKLLKENAEDEVE